MLYLKPSAKAGPSFTGACRGIYVYVGNAKQVVCGLGFRQIETIAPRISRPQSGPTRRRILPARSEVSGGKAGFAKCCVCARNRSQQFA